MRQKDALRRDTLRLLKSALEYAALAAKAPLTDAEMLRVVQKETKKRQEAHEQFLKAGRDKEAEQERQERLVLEAYLPQPFTEEELTAAVRQAIADTGAASKKNLGAVIRAVQTAHPGRADGKTLSSLVKDLLP